MTVSWIAAIGAIGAAITAATLIGVLVNRRWGKLHDVADAGVDVAELGLSQTGPTVVHFSAVWCGPCAAVRGVVNQVCEDVPGVAHLEIDIDANPIAAQRLSVLSLPTTLIFDADGRQRYRVAGVPKAADLRSALRPLLV